MTDSKQQQPTVLLLSEYNVSISPQTKELIICQYRTSLGKKAADHVDRLLEAMKEAPTPTLCRCINRFEVKPLMKELQSVLLEWRESQAKILKKKTDFLSISLSVHPLMDDVICVDVHQVPSNEQDQEGQDVNEQIGGELFRNWPRRRACGWPMTHRAVVCDRFCGEAVLRGSHVFVRGILSADANIREGEVVHVYSHVGDETVQRGLMLQNYTGTCVFVGKGFARCNRGEMFANAQGLGIEMLVSGGKPICPPLHGVLQGRMMLQNLPSLVVARALEVEHETNLTIIDMCSAPGGKTSHVASLLKIEQNEDSTIIVACDKSRKKMMTARTLFRNQGANMITLLALDTTKCVVASTKTDRRSVREVLDAAEPSKTDGLLGVKGFFPETFDRVLLDPPCSAMGLRPKLCVDVETDLEKYPRYQKRFVEQAVQLLKPGGVMTYSTCTINSLENERMVDYVVRLKSGSEMELVDVGIDLGGPGLAGHGLDDDQRRMVRRFDAVHHGSCMTGFFIAKFRKVS